jgi:hypothetical protein
LLPPRASDMLAVRDRAIDGTGLSPARFAALPAATRTSTSKSMPMPGAHEEGPVIAAGLSFFFELERLGLEIHATYATATPRRAAAS